MFVSCFFEIMNLVINTDGASRGNPGAASYGYLIKDANSGAILHEEGKRIGVTTNNIAEYTAVLKSLEYVKNRYSYKAPHKIEVISDSQLIAQQLAGNWKIKNAGLKKIFDQIKMMEFDLGHVSYRNVPREQNFIADRLANKALDDERV